MRSKFHTSIDNVWFTSDLHFGHRAMLRPDVCGRPWSDVEAMDTALIENWNRVVGERDHVFVLGDVSFRGTAGTMDILAELRGIKYLIRGNHDKKMQRGCLMLFDGGVEDYHEITVDDQPIVLCHFPFRSWNRMHYGAWNLHGHSHGTLKPAGRQMDVGVDAVGHRRHPEDYAPINFLVIDLKTAPIDIVDHHAPKLGENDVLYQR